MVEVTTQLTGKLIITACDYHFHFSNQSCYCSMHIRHLNGFLLTFTKGTVTKKMSDYMLGNVLCNRLVSDLHAVSDEKTECGTVNK